MTSQTGFILRCMAYMRGTWIPCTRLPPSPLLQPPQGQKSLLRRRRRLCASSPLSIFSVAVITVTIHMAIRAGSQSADEIAERVLHPLSWPMVRFPVLNSADVKAETPSASVHDMREPVHATYRPESLSPSPTRNPNPHGLPSLAQKVQAYWPESPRKLQQSKAKRKQNKPSGAVCLTPSHSRSHVLSLVR